jgi:hypothetical protein
VRDLRELVPREVVLGIECKDAIKVLEVVHFVASIEEARHALRGRS